MAKTKRICSVDGCGKIARSRGWCIPHYKRWQRYGDPLGGRTPTGEPLAFLETAVFSYNGGECLTWPYARAGVGYGTINIGGKMRYVHRIVCEVEHGPPPTPRHEAAHICGKGHLGCVNRKHLAWKTPKENQADKLIHGTHGRGERSTSAKLTEAQVLQIRAAQGTKRAIARRFGISEGAIYGIISRRTWAYIE